MAEPTARAWRVVLDAIEQDLLDGTYGPGDHLPPERELSTIYGVGRSSVREALRVLEVMGLIRTATGSGPTSGAIIVATPRGGLSALLRLQVAAKGFEISDVVETRLILEAWTVTHLASHPELEFPEARALIRAMHDPALTPQEFLALDAQFHLDLADAAGNTIVSATMGGLRHAIEGYVQTGARSVADWGAMATRLAEEHEAILDAVDAQDPDLARTRMLAHIDGYYAATGLAQN